MRPRMLLALGLMLTLASVGCARGSTDGTGVATARTGAPTAASSSASAAPADADMALKFSKCMRQQGLTWFPDPDASGRMTVSTPKGVNPKTVDAAQRACKKYAPAGPNQGKPDPQAVEQARLMAKCMRANGVPNFPDPSADGGIQIDGNKLGTGPGDPTFDKAEAACSKYAPPGAHRGTSIDGGKQSGTSGGQG